MWKRIPLWSGKKPGGNGEFHDYYTRSRNDIHKSSATRHRGLWSSVNFSSNIWNRLDTSLREAETLSSFKCGLSKAILWYLYVHLHRTQSNISICIYFKIFLKKIFIVLHFLTIVFNLYRVFFWWPNRKQLLVTLAFLNKGCFYLFIYLFITYTEIRSFQTNTDLYT